jgi:hypothetical protein
MKLLNFPRSQNRDLGHPHFWGRKYSPETWATRRFATKRVNGEWFELNREDVDAFKRCKFM